MEVGLLPALGSGLGDLQRTGQAGRLIDGYLRPYAARFERVWYVSYLPETLGQFAADGALPAGVSVLAPAGPRPRLVRALEMPLRHRREFRRCAVHRVFQVTGALPALIARRWWGTPFVTTCGFWYARLARGRASRLGVSLLERAALRAAAAVIVTTAELRAHAATMAPPERIHLIPNGVDLARFAPRGEPGRRRGRIVYLGRLSEEKNLSALVQAVAALRGRVATELVMVGDGPLRAALEAQARAAGVAIQFPGVVDHRRVPDWLRSADAFVLPSFTEGHPKALVEAMAAGLVCVVSDCAGNRALVTDGLTGLLFDPRDPAALAAQLERALTDDALGEKLGLRARELVARDYDLARLVAEEIALVERVGGRG